MLDLSDLAVVDNHCHPVLLTQQMDVLQFRSYCTEATHASFATTHVHNTVYYQWLLRQMAAFYDCEPTEQVVIAARNSFDADALLHRLVQAAKIDTLVLDPGYPLPDVCYSPEQMGTVGGCRTVKLLRLETLMQRLVSAHGDFDEVVTRFSNEVSRAREQGYCGFKSIAAYRTGLNIMQWQKDAAVEAFIEARTEAVNTGQLRIAHKPLIEYLLHIAFRIAAEQQLPIQFHTGYGDSDTDMRLGNPLHLREVLERRDYQSMPIVLLHESYPYCQLGAYLAAVYPHVYFDLSYMIPFVDKLEMLAFTRQAFSVAPASKLMYSSDGTNLPEMHYVSAPRGRAIIGQVLQEMIDADELDNEMAYHLARQVLRETAYKVYNL
ncbi:MAG TPA: amidohydrolase family protein [Ktedonobacteraceae bacterium]|nr:amidohydrolase family protein [Ktedonobacteraceae bacterium]